jgi:hypothetical protein
MERFKAIFFIVVGTALLIGAMVTAVGVRRFMNESLVAEGRVVSLNAGGSHPQIAFTTRHGEQISYAQGGWIGGYAAGDAVRVRYREADPARSASIDSVGALFFWPLLMAVLGGVFAAGGIAEWISRSKG